MTAMQWSTYSGGDLAGWLVSEKLDGVRGQWDGARLLSKSGRQIAAPAWFTAGLPPVPLDGELYAGPGVLDWLQGLTRRARCDEAAWLGVRFCVFDAPATPGGFGDRLEALGRLAGALPPHVCMVHHQPCPGRPWLSARFSGVLAAGGEGLVARHPSGQYHSGERSQWVVKIKQHPDTRFLLEYSGEEIEA